MTMQYWEYGKIQYWEYGIIQYWEDEDPILVIQEYPVLGIRPHPISGNLRNPNNQHKSKIKQQQPPKQQHQNARVPKSPQSAPQGADGVITQAKNGSPDIIPTPFGRNFDEKKDEIAPGICRPHLLQNFRY